MAEIAVPLKRGWKIGETTHMDVALREPNVGDILDAGTDSERVVWTERGAQLVSSPTLAGAHMLRRQIVRVGDLKDVVVTLDMLRRLHPEDFELLQEKANELGAAMLEETDARGRAARGS